MASWASARARARSIARSYHAPGAAPERRASRRASRGAGPMLTAVSMEHTDPAQLGFDPERLERVLGAIDADIAAGRCDGVALCVAPEELAGSERLVAWACTTAPESLPGERVTYSIAVAHAVMAEMVRRAEGGKRSFARILEDDLFRPLGMRETSLGPRDDLVPRLCPVAARFTEPGLFGPSDVDGIGALFSMLCRDAP